MARGPAGRGRVLVTGHAGYLGSVLLPRLLAAGWRVEGLDSGLFADCGFAPAGRGPTVPARRMDLRDIKPEQLRGLHCVLHLAGLSNDPLGDMCPILTDRINRQATIDLAIAARAAGVERFIFASSCSNYGNAGDELLDEEAPLRPLTLYGRSKVAAEAALSQLSETGFAVTSLRLATAYGLSPFLRFDLVVNNLVAWASAEGRVFLKSDGSPWRPIVHVEDIAGAFLAALEAPARQVAGKVWNVVPPGENYRVSELAALVAAAVPGAEIVHAADAGPDRRNYRVSGRRIACELPGWHPRWTAAQGVADLARCLTKARPPASEFEGSRYQRVAHLVRQQHLGLLDGQLRPAASTPKGEESAGLATA